jgi:hypothetical protein
MILIFEWSMGRSETLVEQSSRRQDLRCELLMRQSDVLFNATAAWYVY